MKKRKLVNPVPAPEPKEGACGIRLENINPNLPPDNEHSSAGTVALAKAVSDLAGSIQAAARALEETARHSQKAGVYIGNCSVSNIQ